MTSFKKQIRGSILLAILCSVASIVLLVSEVVDLPPELKAFDDAQLARLGGPYYYLGGVAVSGLIFSLFLLWQLKIQGVYIAFFANALDYANDHFFDVFSIYPLLVGLTSWLGMLAFTVAWVLVWVENSVQKDALTPPQNSVGS